VQRFTYRSPAGGLTTRLYLNTINLTSIWCGVFLWTKRTIITAEESLGKLCFASALRGLACLLTEKKMFILFGIINYNRIFEYPKERKGVSKKINY
jgi:hypothetical protein